MCSSRVSQRFGQSLYTEFEFPPSLLSRISSSLSTSFGFTKLLSSDTLGQKDQVFNWSFSCLTQSFLGPKALVNMLHLCYSLLSHFKSSSESQRFCSLFSAYRQLLGVWYFFPPKFILSMERSVLQELSWLYQKQYPIVFLLLSF